MKTGLFIQPPKDSREGGSVDYKINVGKLIGIEYQRMTVTCQDWSDKQLNTLKRVADAGFKIILNVKNTTAAQKEGEAVKDIEVYKQQLAKILDDFKPELLCIENEQIADNHYLGTAQEYLTELNAAIEVAHSKGVQITDGALTTLAELVYLNYKKNLQNVSAAEFATKAGFTSEDIKRLDRHFSGKKIIQNLTDSETLLDGFKNSNLDFVSFHWYIRNVDALNESVKFLRERTGKQVITTEIGQYDTSEVWVSEVMTMCKALDLPYCIWFSGDGDNAFALQENESTLRPSGAWFKSFINV